jgi:hypothetical protein
MPDKLDDIFLGYNCSIQSWKLVLLSIVGFCSVDEVIVDT